MLRSSFLVANITRFITSGFGSQEFHGETSSKLMKVVIDYFTADECRKTYRTSRRKLRNGIVESSQLCAGGKFEMKDSCQVKIILDHKTNSV